jgi:hypothetical protein
VPNCRAFGLPALEVMHVTDNSFFSGVQAFSLLTFLLWPLIALNEETSEIQQKLQCSP